MNKGKSLLATWTAAGYELRGKEGPEAQKRAGLGVCKAGRGRAPGSCCGSGGRSSEILHTLANSCCCELPCPLHSPDAPNLPTINNAPVPAPASGGSCSVSWCLSLAGWSRFWPCLEEGLLTTARLPRVSAVLLPPHGLLGHHVIQVSHLRQPFQVSRQADPPGAGLTGG